MERSICQVLNTHDKTTMTIIMEWFDDEIIKVTVLRKGMIPMSGETTVERQLVEYPRTDVAREKSLLDIRNELSGRENDVKFFLREGRLLWKKKAWWKGGMDVYPIEDLVTLTDTSLRWLNEQANLQDSNARMQRENKSLQKDYDELIAKLQAIEASKNSMETALFTKFLVILNEKKKRIRYLEEMLKSRTRTTDKSAYNEETDESDDQSEEPITRSENEQRPFSHDIAASAITDNAKSHFRSSPESEQDEIILKFEESPDNLNTEEDDNLFAS